MGNLNPSHALPANLFPPNLPAAVLLEYSTVPPSRWRRAPIITDEERAALLDMTAAGDTEAFGDDKCAPDALCAFPDCGFTLGMIRHTGCAPLGRLCICGGTRQDICCHDFVAP